MLFSHLVILLTIFLIVDHSIALKCEAGYIVKYKGSISFKGEPIDCNRGINFCVFVKVRGSVKNLGDELFLSCDEDDGYCEGPGEIKSAPTKKLMITRFHAKFKTYDENLVNSLEKKMFAFCCMEDLCNHETAFSGSSSNNQLNEPFGKSFGKSFGKENNNYQGVFPVRYQDPYDFRSTNNFEGSNNFLHRTVFIGLWLSLIMII